MCGGDATFLSNYCDRLFNFLLPREMTEKEKLISKVNKWSK